jgi:cytochrome c
MVFRVQCGMNQTAPGFMEFHKMRLMMTLAVLAGAALGPQAQAAAPAEFAMCAACHSVKAGQNLIGPSLAGIAGRKSASAAGFAYSPAVKGLGLTWTDANLDKWLTNPMKMAPGTKMAFAGYPDAAKRKAVIAYLKTLK